MTLTLLVANTLLVFAQAVSQPAANDPALGASKTDSNAVEPTETKALFREADRLAKAAQHAEAAAKTEEAVTGVRDPARRAEIAALYLNAAEILLNPTDPEKRPEPGRAWPLLAQAEDLEAFGDREADALIEMLRVAQALKHPPADRIARARSILKRFPDDDRRDEVIYRLGHAEAASKDLLAARSTWEQLVNAPPRQPGPSKSDASPHVDWRTQAARRLADLLLKKAKDVSWLGHAIEAVDQSARVAPEDDETAGQLLSLAALLAAQPGRRDAAVDRLKRVEDLFPGTEFAGRAALTHARWLIAWGHADQGIERLENFLSARAVDQLFREGTAELTNARFSEAGRLLERARAQVTGKRDPVLNRSAKLFTEFLEAAPADPRVPAGLMSLAEISKLRGDKQGARKQWRDLIDRFPKDSVASEAAFRIAESIVQDGRYTEGLAALGKVTGGWKNAATALETKLRKPALEWISTGVLRSGRPAGLRLRCRNIEEVEVRMFAIDLEDVFLADGELDQLARLDVNLIQPDRTEAIRIPDYEPFAEMTHEVIVPLDKPGAMVVSVRHDRIEARTVAILSDLEIVTLATRDQIKVVGWANGASDDSVALLDDFDLRASADSRILPQGPIEPPKEGSRFATLGSHEGHLAVAKVETRALGEARTLSQSALIRMQRTTARPGESLAVFGLVSDPEDGTPKPPSDDSDFRLEWWDSGINALLKRVPIGNSTSGQFHETLDLDPAMAGRHSIVARVIYGTGLDEKVLATTTATVDRFPEAARIEFESSPRFRTGDQGSVPMRALTAHGEPFSNRALSLRVGQDPKATLHTDANGRFELDILKRHTRRPGTVTIEVDAGQGTLAQAIVIQSRSITIEVDGRAANGLPGMSGEPFEIPVRTMHQDGTPTEATVRVRVNDPNSTTQSPEAQRIRTNSDGDGVFTFVPDEVGTYTVELSVQGVDHLNDAVPTRRVLNVVVAGDGDAVPVHLIPTVAHPAPGSAVTLRIHSELEDGPALLVTHHETVEHTEAVWLRRGLNSFQLPTPEWPARMLRITCVAGHHPNVVLPTVHLDLKSDLDVTIFPGPRDRSGIDLDLTTLDPSGRSVTGDATLWLIDAGDLERVEADLKRLTGQFAPRRNGSFVAIGTSGTFTIPSIVEDWDPAIGRALSALDAAASMSNAAVMVDSVNLENFIQLEDIPGMEMQNEGIIVDDVIGVGGGSGGRYGGRASGKGGGRRREQALAYQPPAIDTVWRYPVREGQAIVHVETDRARPGQRLAVVAVVIGDDQRIGVTSMLLASKDPIGLTLSGPAILRPDDASSIRASIVNLSDAAQTATVRAETRALGSTDTWTALEDEGSLSLPASGRVEPSFDLGYLTESSEVRVSVGRAVAIHTVRILAEDPVSDGPATTPLGELITIRPSTTETWGPDDRARRATRLWAVSEQCLAEKDDPDTDTLASGEEAMRSLLALHEGAATKRHSSVGRSANEDHQVEGLELLALSRARDAGLDVPKDLIHRLANSVTRRLADSLDPDEQAWLLYCGSFHADADFARLNRLFRDRDRLGARALALLAGSLARAGRTRDAAVTTKLLTDRNPAFTPTIVGLAGLDPDASNGTPWIFPPHAGPVASAPSDVDPADGDLDEAPLVDTLQIQRRIMSTVAVRGGRGYPIADTALERSSRELSNPDGHPLRLDQPVNVVLSVRWSDAPTGALWIYEPLPAGVELADGSVRHAEVAVPDRQGVWLRLRKTDPASNGAMVNYQIIPRTPGTYGCPDAFVLAGRGGIALFPKMISAATLEIATRDDDPDASLELSADERYEAGRFAFAEGDHQAARDLLLPLVTEKVRPDRFKELVKILTLSSAATHVDADTVRFFEILKQRDPEYVISFDTMIEVGRAYRRMAEHERARDVFLAINDASFLEESQVVGHLERADQDTEALDAMARLAADHADTDTVRSMLFALGQHGYFTGIEIEDSPETAARRKLFLEAGQRALERHRADYPNDPQADDVLLTLGNILLELGRTEEARALSADAVAQKPDGRLVAAFDYMQAYAAFKRRDADAAQALCARVIDRVGPTKTENALTRLADQCRHMTAQILHANGEIAAAKEMYEKIQSRFPDAARALRHLDRQSLVVPELTQVGTAEALTIPLEVYGGGDSVEIRAYPVDLRLLYLKHRSFEHLADLRLAGVTPGKVMTFPMPDANGATKRKTEIQIDLEGTGAWLLVYRVGELQGRGMAIRSDLALDVDDRVGDDVVRVHATTKATGRPSSDVLVTLVGSANSDFITRRSDLRGVCEANGLGGRVAVIAEQDGNYAFFQGLSRAATPQNFQQQIRNDAQEDGQPAQQMLDSFRADNDTLWKSNTNRKQLGVEVQRAGK